jgi:hypothetical protein
VRGLRQDRSARVVTAGHAFAQNPRRGHYELAVEKPVDRRLAGCVRRAGPGGLSLHVGRCCCAP